MYFIILHLPEEITIHIGRNTYEFQDMVKHATKNNSCTGNLRQNPFVH